MNITLFTILGLIAGGCAADNSLGSFSESERNVGNLTRLCIGMTEDQVLCIMKLPYSKETIALQNDTYEVWFYVTQPGVLGQSRMVTMNLTPLTFKNGTLVGTGNDYYRHVLDKQQGKTKPQKTKSTEDNERLEKALRSLVPSNQNTSMSARPEHTDGAEDEADQENKTPLKESDGQMLRLEGDQNFDFW